MINVKSWRTVLLFDEEVCPTFILTDVAMEKGIYSYSYSYSYSCGALSVKQALLHRRPSGNCVTRIGGLH